MPAEDTAEATKKREEETLPEMSAVVTAEAEKKEEERRAYAMAAGGAHAVLFFVATCVWLWAITTNPEWPAWNIKTGVKGGGGGNRGCVKDVGSVRLRRWGLPRVCVSVHADDQFWCSQKWRCRTLTTIRDEMKSRQLTHVDSSLASSLFTVDGRVLDSRRQRGEVYYNSDAVAPQLAWICTDPSDDVAHLSTAGALQYVVLISTPVLGVVGVALAVYVYTNASVGMCGVVSMGLVAVMSCVPGILAIEADRLIATAHTSRCSPNHPSMKELNYTRTPTAEYVLATCLFAHALVCAFSARMFYIVRRLEHAAD